MRAAVRPAGQVPTSWSTPGRLRFIGGLAIASIWELAGRASDSLLLPSFLETLRALAILLIGGELWGALWSSNQTLIVGFALALAIGVPAGLTLGRWNAVGRWVDPYLHLLLVVPTTALVPLVLIVGGASFLTRAAVVASFALPIIVQCIRSALQQVDPRWREVARAFCATPAQEWRCVLLPAAVPGIALGVRLGLARAVEGMVVAELLLVAVGVGGLILDRQGRFDAAAVYAVVWVVMAEAAVLTYGGRALERRLAPRAAARRD